MSGLDLGGGSSSGGFGAMLDRMPSIDAITVLVLGFDAYILYTELDYTQSNIFTVSNDPHIIALQTTLALVAVYAIEFMHDKDSH